MTGRQRERAVTGYLSRHLFLPLASFVAQTSLTPDRLSLLSFVIALGCLPLFAVGANIAAGFLILAIWLADNVNGVLTRIKRGNISLNKVWDAFFARYGDAAIIGGMAIWAFRNEDWPWPLLVGLLALSGSLAVSYMQARIEASAPTAVAGSLLPLGSRDIRLPLAAVGSLAGLAYFTLALMGGLAFAVVTAQLLLMSRRPLP